MEIKTNIHPADAIYVIHQAFKHYETDPQPSSALNETTESLQKELNEGTKLLGAFDKEKLIGVVKYILNDEHIYFARLSVLPKNQGKGAAKALIQHIENIAIQNQKNESQCKVRKSEKGNIALYSKLGYEIVKEELIVNKNGDEIPTVTMVKKLSIVL